MDDQNKNLLLATVLSGLVILVWSVFIAPPTPPVDTLPSPTAQTTGQDEVAPAIPAPADGTAMTAPETEAPAVVAESPRISINTPRLEGSISLAGGRIDQLSLKSYRETLDPTSSTVKLFAPVGEPQAYYALHGWAAGTGLTSDDVPGLETVWSIEQGETLTPETPVTLRWNSPSGLIFRRVISVDPNYLFNIEQKVENPTDIARSAQPYGFIARHGLPDLANFFILHEGVVGMHNGELIESGYKYKDIRDLEVDTTLQAPGERFDDVSQSWIGFTDKYWMTSLIPATDEVVDLTVRYLPRSDIYQTQILFPTLQIAAGEKVSNSSRLFAGAKEWDIIKTYEEKGGITNFIDSIDWGWFFFLTKPIFSVLHWLNGVIGNMGIAIIALTLIIKALLFPLAYKSYVSMAKMKELQPQMEKIKEVAGDDRQKLQQEMMALYKKEKVNPASGCLPILLQIPIFFSLYKVIFVTIELRHAAFFGPFQDLSAPDPTSFFNLFGLLPFAAPEAGSILALIFIGILPLLLGISMWLQQKLNPAPTDPTQQMIFAWMPWVFMFMLGGFASGLVVYWIANNTITFTQQYIIMRSQGFKPDVFGNIRSGLSRKKPEAK